MSEYWERVEQRWTASMEAVQAGRIDDSAQLRRQRMTFFPLPSVPIAITGVRGAGKSVIYDALAGRIGKSYVPAGRSEHIDRFRVKTGQRRRRRCTAVIVPGQLASDDQEQAFNSMFRSGNHPKGVIHVVSWGYDWIWGKERRRAVSEYSRNTGAELNLESLRADNMTEELKFFQSTCDLLRQAWSARPPGIWLIVAVAKSDLYWPRIEEAKSYYLPGSDQNNDSEFSAILRSLVTDLHEGGLSQLAVLPISSLSEPFDFSESTHFNFQTEITAESTLEDVQRQALVNRIQLMIGEFNAK